MIRHLLRSPVFLLALGLFFTIVPFRSALAANDDGVDTGPAPLALADRKQLEAEEDRIDQLPAGEQTPALLELRRQWTRLKAPVAQLVLQRLNLKLAFVAEQANLADLSSADPAHPVAYADRLSLSRQAAEIGATYLKQNDPSRAHPWEARSRGFAAESLWPDDLRNQIHAWYERRLTAALDAEHWSDAREELAAWKKDLGQDTAVLEGINLYAQTRAANLIQSLDLVEPRVTLKALAEEEAANPGCSAWQTVRDRVAAALDHDFQHSVAGRDIAGARLALDLQTAIAAEYHFDEKRAPIAANNHVYDALVRDLQPNPIQRQYGHVHAVQFRIEVMQTGGDSHYSHSGINLRSFTFFPYAVGDWRIYADETNASWFGFNMTGLQGGLARDFQSGGRYQVQGFFLIGRRGEIWSGSLGAGLAYNSLYFQDGPTKTANTSTTVSLALRIDYERILAEKWTLYGTGIVSKGAGVGGYEIKFGCRYYFNHNFSVGVHAMLTEIAVAASDGFGSYHMAAKTLGPSMLMQF